MRTVFLTLLIALVGCSYDPDYAPGFNPTYTAPAAWTPPHIDPMMPPPAPPTAPPTNFDPGYINEIRPSFPQRCIGVVPGPAGYPGTACP